MSDVINRAFYSILPANVRYDKELTANAKLLYSEITALCSEKGYCWASNEYFAKLYGVSKKSVSTWISQLASKKYITVEIEYKEGSKEILHRYLRILPHPMEEKVNTPMEEKVKENNTIINNTINNYIVEIIDYLNDVCGTSYKYSSKKATTLIKARLNEKYTVDDFKKVINTMHARWKGTEFEQYLRPATLFNGEKFEGYLNQKVSNNTYTKNNTQTKIEKFNKMYSHDWDFDEIEQLEREYIDRMLAGDKSE